jgi:hypothetical protein
MLSLVAVVFAGLLVHVAVRRRLAARAAINTVSAAPQPEEPPSTETADGSG